AAVNLTASGASKTRSQSGVVPPQSKVQDCFGVRREAKRHAAFAPLFHVARPVRCTEGNAVSPLRSATALQMRLFSTQTTSHRVRVFLAPDEVRADKAVRAPISPFLESRIRPVRDDGPRSQDV